MKGRRRGHSRFAGALFRCSLSQHSVILFGAYFCTIVQLYAPVKKKGAAIVTIGARLKAERQRLGLNQVDFAKIADASKRALIDWEKGVRSPNALALSAFADAGVDILYVLTGERRQSAQDASGSSSASYAEAVMDDVEAGFESSSRDFQSQLEEFARDAGLPDRTRARADRILASQGDENARRRLEKRERQRDEAFERARRFVREARFVVDWEPPEALEAELIRLIVNFDVDSRQIEALMRTIRDMSNPDRGGAG